jgi:hypothetical protein
MFQIYCLEDKMTDHYTAAELAAAKGANIHTVYRILRSPERRRAELPGSKQRIISGKAVWLIPRRVGDDWTPKRVGYQGNIAE